MTRRMTRLLVDTVALAAVAAGGALAYDGLLDTPEHPDPAPVHYTPTPDPLTPAPVAPTPTPDPTHTQEV